MKYPIYKPEITQRERNYVLDCIDSTWISSKGKYIAKFEEILASYTGSKYAIAVFNGTVALHLALAVYGIRSSDEVIVPNFSYIAVANCVKYVGAKPIFTDVDPDTWNISVENIQQVITKKTKAIIVVDIYGNPVDMKPIIDLAEDNDLFVVEDAAEALGATYNQKMAGNLADIGIFSFFGNKTITTGEGGALITNDVDIYNLCQKVKNQGNSKDIKYFHDVLGYNFRMTNIQAAIGYAQMERINSILTNKRKIFDLYKDFIDEKHVIYQKTTPNSQSSYWLVSILLENESLRNNLAVNLHENDIDTRPLFKPMNKMPYFDSKQEFHYSTSISQRGLSLPSYHTLRKSDIRYISEKINNFLG